IGSYRLHAPPDDSPDGDAAPRSTADSDRVNRWRTLLIMNGAAERARPGYFEDDLFVSIFPVASNTFISELGEGLQFDRPTRPSRYAFVRPMGTNTWVRSTMNTVKSRWSLSMARYAWPGACSFPPA